MNTSKILRGLIAFLLIATTIVSLAYADHTIDLTSEWTANDSTSLSVDRGEEVELFVYVTSTEDFGLWIEILRGTTVVDTVFADSSIAADIDDSYIQEFTIDTADLAGDYTVYVLAENTEGGESQELSLHVETVPSISVTPDTYEVDEEETLVIPRIVVIDFDGDELTTDVFQRHCIFFPIDFCWNSTLLDGDLELAETDGRVTSITYTPEYDEVVHPDEEEILTLILRAYDEDGTASPDETVTIEVHDVNQIPDITSTPVTEAAEGVVYSYPVTATDGDDEDELEYSLLEGPAGMTFDKLYRLRWTPGYADAGEHDVTIQVTDGIDEDTQSFTITVDNTNRAPILAPIGDRTVLEEEELTFTVTGSDPDGDLLSFSAEDLPEGVVFDEATQEFSWTPTSEQIGSYEVTFTVSDGSLTDSETITITVVEEENLAPVLEPIGDRVIMIGEYLKFKVRASDPNGDSLTFRLEDFSLEATGAYFVDNGDGTATFGWTPRRTMEGVYEATFIVSDGELEDSETITITVGSPEVPVDDADSDTIPDDDDNCPFTFNPGQADADGDGIGDACDSDVVPCTDDNANGICDEDELLGCTDPAATNWNPEADIDDGSCAYPLPGDADGDGILDAEDNCPLTFNPGQEDADGDGIGDACDSDVVPCTDDNANGICDDDEVPLEVCEDGIDNDLDGLVDEGCVPPVEVCDDIDNDGDGLVDEGCPLPPVEICADGVDNDGDGFVDEADCEPVPPTTEVCGDGIDNDLDGLVDEGCPVPCTDADGNGICDEDEVPGCTDPMAFNYAPAADVDDGSCLYPELDEELELTRVQLSSEVLAAGDTLFLSIHVENEGSVDLEDLQISVLSYDLGVYRATSRFDLDEGNSTSRLMALQIPEGTRAGEHLLKITAGNPDHRESAYRSVWVW